MTTLIDELKTLIIKTLDLKDLEIDDIEESDPLFIDGLGLDSVDSLALTRVINKKYHITLDPAEEASKHYMTSIETLAEYIEAQQAL